MKRAVAWAVGLLALGALVVAGLRLAGVKPFAGAPGGRDASPTAVAQAIELAPTDVATVRQAELVRSLAVSGGLKAAETALVKAKVASELKELSVREGDRVFAGQRIGRLDATEFEWRLRQAEEQAQSAAAQLAIAERTLANNRALVEQGFISRNALDTAAMNEAGARAALQAAQAAAELARKALRDTEIRAPIGGLVAQRLAQPGERVAVDGRIVEIVDLSRVELEAAVTPEDVTALRVGQAARVRVDGLDQELAARVARINPSAQSTTRAVTAYLAVEPHAALRQDLFARATIDLERRNALVVPVSAVRFDQARPYVLALEGGVAVEKPVTPGTRGQVAIDGQPEAAIEIREGLAAGAVVLRGSVGSLRGGTRLVLSKAGAAAPAGSESAASGASPRP
ncbi:MAG: efflux RND transporter periplasmic adaptor subunit [Pseudomonadota bacterium]|nr:efflux RND transporter periplasmic adaptor subunit [Rubrivivax sp.]MCA3258275.1 efflux RND transporter periplasmic adaptor subunit [Rubrivivax sp.]MCE2912819.1 efflux RND transporter periplasmic adaptor subunit [Rubrivivax sp.]MCZ8032554.1 efflux RND transporter periplasmic adaptor subunit [Rubrivivax sp.]